MKLHRFGYSPYVRKVQMVLDLLGRRYQPVEVPYLDRSELVGLTGGYIQVPVLVEDDGRVIFDSRRICEHLLVGEAARSLVPPPFDGPIWAYCDWCDGPLEDVLFRVATPFIRDLKTDPAERALYVYIKERKFGPGCVEQWERSREELLARGNQMLAPTVRTLAAQPFLFGEQPTLADAALWGLVSFLGAASSTLPDRLDPQLCAWSRRVEEVAAARRYMQQESK